jgi:hypothetical protein
MKNKNELPLFEQEVLLAAHQAVATGSKLSESEADEISKLAATLVAQRIRGAATSFLADSTGPTDEHANMLLTWIGSGMRAHREREEGRPGSA